MILITFFGMELLRRISQISSNVSSANEKVNRVDECGLKRSPERCTMSFPYGGIPSLIRV